VWTVPEEAQVIEKKLSKVVFSSAGVEDVILMLPSISPTTFPEKCLNEEGDVVQESNSSPPPFGSGSGSSGKDSTGQGRDSGVGRDGTGLVNPNRPLLTSKEISGKECRINRDLTAICLEDPIEERMLARLRDHLLCIRLTRKLPSQFKQNKTTPGPSPLDDAALTVGGQPIKPAPGSGFGSGISSAGDSDGGVQSRASSAGYVMTFDMGGSSPVPVDETPRPFGILFTAPHAVPLLRDVPLSSERYATQSSCKQAAQVPLYEVHKQEDYSSHLANLFSDSIGPSAGSLTWSPEETKRVKNLTIQYGADNKSIKDRKKHQEAFSSYTQSVALKESGSSAIDESTPSTSSTTAADSAAKKEEFQKLLSALSEAGNRDPNFLHTSELSSNPWHLSLSQMLGRFQKGLEEEDNNLSLHVDIHGCINPGKPPHHYEHEVFLGFSAMERVEIAIEAMIERGELQKPPKASEIGIQPTVDHQASNATSTPGGTGAGKFLSPTPGTVGTAAGSSETGDGTSPGNRRKSLDKQGSNISQLTTDTIDSNPSQPSQTSQSQFPKYHLQDSDNFRLSDTFRKILTRKLSEVLQRHYSPTQIESRPLKRLTGASKVPNRYTMTQQSVGLGFDISVQLELSYSLRKALYKDPDFKRDMGQAFKESAEEVLKKVHIPTWRLSRKGVDLARLMRLESSNPS